MNTNRIVVLTVGFVVAVVLVAGVLIPVIGNTTGGGEKTYTNIGTPFEKIGSDVNHTYTFGKTRIDDGIYNLYVNMDGQTIKEWRIDLTITSGTLEQTMFFYPILMFDTPEGTGTEGVYYSPSDAYLTGGEDTIMWLSYSPEGSESAGFLESTLEDTSTTITITNGIVDYNIDDTVTSEDKEYTYCLSTHGEYVWAENPYVKSDTKIMTYSAMSAGTIVGDELIPYYMFTVYMEGDIENLTPAKYTNGGLFIGNNSYNIENVTYETHKTDNGDLIKLKDVTANVTYKLRNGTETFEKEWAINQFFVPSSVTGTTESVSPAMNTLLTTIPILILVGLVVGAATIMIGKRD